MQFTSHYQPMRGFLRPLLPMALVLAIPIIPFLLFEKSIEDWFAGWKANDPSGSSVALVVVSLLAGDIFLPIPSSLVCTLAGWKLGILGGTLTNWLGMNAGAVIGFALARRFGLPLARYFSRPEDLSRAGQLVDRYGPAVLIIGRGVPVVAEASVLIAGLHALSWQRFLLPVLLSNLGLSAAYAGIGKLAEGYHAMQIALASSILIPGLFAVVFHISIAAAPSRTASK